MLMNFNVANNNCQQEARFLYIFVSNKSFGQLLEILATNFILLKTFESGFSYIEVWFTDQSSEPVKIEG